ncbi:MAG: hypothetical protein K2J44_07280, partial [Ruminococcus sp.]|nr:hypothetical protein [Ruminococcus sp.]
DFVQGVDYALNGSQLRINNSYLSKLSDGVHNFHIAFDGTDDLILKVTVGADSTKPSGSEATLYGDADESGKVNINDAVLIMQSIANPDKYKLTEQGKINADVVDNGNGITNSDAIAIQYVVSRTITEKDFPLTMKELSELES